MRAASSTSSATTASSTLSTATSRIPDYSEAPGLPILPQCSQASLSVRDDALVVCLMANAAVVPCLSSLAMIIFLWASWETMLNILSRDGKCSVADI